MRSGERRTGLRLSTTAVAAAVLLIAGVAREAVSGPATDGLHAQQRVAMGTVFRILVYERALSEDHVRVALDAALSEVGRLDRVLSHYDRHSELSRLVRAPVGVVTQVSADLYAALDQSLAMTRLSQGRFDVTVGPLVELWRAAAGRPGGPDSASLADARRCVGSGRLTLVPPRGVRLSSPCLHLDLGGIGKGIAVGRAIDVLRAHGIANAMVNGGGSTMMAMGRAPGHDGWPVQAAGLNGPLMLRDRALSTSEATAEVIAIEPGRPEASRATVSVLVEDAAMADALSTALLLSTVDQGREILQHVPGGSAWWTGLDGAILAVAGTAPRGGDGHDGATR